MTLGAEVFTQTPQRAWWRAPRVRDALTSGDPARLTVRDRCRRHQGQ